MRCILIIWLIFCHLACIGQKNDSLSINKKYPVYLEQTSPCKDVTLIKQLADSLRSEGYNLIDSTQAMSELKAFFKEAFKYEPPITLLQFQTSLDKKWRTKKLYQGIVINKYSCIDTLHNYTVSVYMAPRNNTSRDSQSFTLSFKSPYSIPAIILSLIDRK